MWLGLLALLVGLVLGYLFTLVAFLPPRLSIYLGLVFLASLDAILGAWRSSLEGDYDTALFLSGFCVNAVAACLLAYFGDLMQMDLALAAVIVFGMRLFQNLAAIRRSFLQRWLKRVG